MGLFESIADRRINEARRAGLFDNLPGHGKPIPDLGQERPAGWWAARVVKTERDKMKFEDLQKELRAALPSLWRLETEIDVRTRIAELNQQLNGYNARTAYLSVEPLDVEPTVDLWRRVNGRSR